MANLFMSIVVTNIHVQVTGCVFSQESAAMVSNNLDNFVGNDGFAGSSSATLVALKVVGNNGSESFVSNVTIGCLFTSTENVVFAGRNDFVVGLFVAVVDRICVGRAEAKKRSNVVET